MSSNFEIERKELMTKVCLGAEQLKSSLGELNRNLESLNTIGHEFTAPAKVWHIFHKSVMDPDNIPTLLDADRRTTKQRQQHHDHDMPSIQPPAHSHKLAAHHHSQQ